MKKRLGLTALALLTIVGIVGCAPSETTTDPTTSGGEVSSTDQPSDSSTDVGVKVARITVTNPSDTIIVGEEVDLAEYATVHYSDGTTDHDITVTTGTGYTVEGTKVTVTASGTYNIKVSAVKDSSKTGRIQVKAATAERLAFNDLFNSIANNYVAEEVQISEDANGEMKMSLGGWTRHNETYGDYYYNSNLNHITAKLSNGSFYNGTHKDVKGLDNFGVEYEPGKVTNWDNLYLSQNLNEFFEAEAVFESEFTVDEETGEEVETFVMAPEYANEFIGFTACLTYGDPDDFTLTVLDWSEGDEEKGESAYILYMYTWTELEDDSKYDSSSSVISAGTKEVQYYDTWMITDIGSASSSVIEASQKDSSYLPPEIEYDKLTTALKAVNTAKNYTIVYQPRFLNQSGSAVSEYKYASAFGTQQVVVTENSVSFYVYSDKSWVLSYGFTLYQDNYYWYSTTNGEKTITQASKLTSIWDDLSDLVAFDVDGLDSLNFTSTSSGNTSSTTYTSWTSDAGDNDGKTQTNKFAYSLFSKYYQATVFFDNSDSFAQGMTMPLEFGENEYHAGTINGSFTHYVFGNGVLQWSYLWSLRTFGMNDTDSGAYYLYLTIKVDNVGSSVEPDVSAWTSLLDSDNTSTSAQ